MNFNRLDKAKQILVDAVSMNYVSQTLVSLSE
jgi:hypothetical protein